jgi:hypothetical protein
VNKLMTCAALAAALISCKEGASREAPPLPAPTVPATPPTPPQPTTGELLMASSSLPVAIGIISPNFKDTENDTDPAAALFALWALNNMTWTELQALPETKHALVLKDSVAERGKRNCYTGVIVEIEVDRSAGKPLYLGGLATHSGQVARFAAVGSTGDLVQKSGAKFCGVVTGRSSYSNSAGGTTHGVFLVGMFDLPENRGKVAAR